MQMPQIDASDHLVRPEPIQPTSILVTEFTKGRSTALPRPIHHDESLPRSMRQRPLIGSRNLEAYPEGDPEALERSWGP